MADLIDNATLTRRQFLHYAIGGLGGIAGAAVLFPTLAYFLSPIWQSREQDWVLLTETTKIPHDRPVKIDFVQRRKDGWMTIEEKRSAWVTTEDGTSFTAFHPACTHLGCPYNWNEARGQFFCPCHTAVFDRHGAVISGPPPRPLDRFPTKVDDGKLWILPEPQTGEG